LIEAFEVEGASAFAYAVQWHPEWKPAENHFYSAMFKAFGDACRLRQRNRLAQVRATCCAEQRGDSYE
jgi:putative glutamine amidotransferase